MEIFLVLCILSLACNKETRYYLIYFLYLFQSAQNCHILAGIVIVYGAPKNSRLLFANGSLLFCKANA